MAKYNDYAVEYARRLIVKYGGNGTPSINATGLKTSGEVVNLILTGDQRNQWILDNGAGWNKDAPGKDEYNNLVKATKAK